MSHIFNPGSWLLCGALLIACDRDPEPASSPPPAEQRADVEADAATPPPEDAITTTTPSSKRLEVLKRAGSVGLEPNFEALLTRHKQRPDLAAPEGLRGLLASEPLKQVRVTRGYHHHDGRDGLSWFLSEHSVQGTPQEVLDGLEATLSEQGFSENPDAARGPFKHAWERALDDDVRERVRFEPPQAAIGGKDAFAGGMLDWSLERPADAPLTFGALLRETPYLRDSRIDDSIYRGLSDLPVEVATLGGTWTRYYSLSVTFAQDDAVTFEALRGVLEGAGFSVQDTNPKLTRFKRAKTGSFAQLYAPDEAGRLRLHIQPES